MDSGKRVCPNTRYPRPDNLQPLSRNLQAKKSPFHCSLTSFEMGFSHWVNSHRKTFSESICFLTRPVFCCLQSVPICFERSSLKILYLAWGHDTWLHFPHLFSLGLQWLSRKEVGKTVPKSLEHWSFREQEKASLSTRLMNLISNRIRNPYGRLIASLGQTDAQVPHSVHASASIL